MNSGPSPCPNTSTTGSTTPTLWPAGAARQRARPIWRRSSTLTLPQPTWWIRVQEASAALTPAQGDLADADRGFQRAGAALLADEAAESHALGKTDRRHGHPANRRRLHDGEHRQTPAAASNPSSSSPAGSVPGPDHQHHGAGEHDGAVDNGPATVDHDDQHNGTPDNHDDHDRFRFRRRRLWRLVRRRSRG